MIERRVRFESPSHSDEALRGMARILLEDAISLGLNAVTQPLSTDGAPLVHIHNRRPGDTRPGILVLGHYDTVHPIVTLEKNPRSEEHTSELQSLMRISYDVFCLKKHKQTSAI